MAAKSALVNIVKEGRAALVDLDARLKKVAELEAVEHGRLSQSFSHEITLRKERACRLRKLCLHHLEESTLRQLEALRKKYGPNHPQHVPRYCRLEATALRILNQTNQELLYELQWLPESEENDLGERLRNVYQAEERNLAKLASLELTLREEVSWDGCSMERGPIRCLHLPRRSRPADGGRPPLWPDPYIEETLEDFATGSNCSAIPRDMDHNTFSSSKPPPYQEEADPRSSTAVVSPPIGPKSANHTTSFPPIPPDYHNKSSSKKEAKYSLRRYVTDILGRCGMISATPSQNSRT